MATINTVPVSTEMPILGKPEVNSLLQSKFPIWSKEFEELHLSDDEFKSFIQSIAGPPPTPMPKKSDKLIQKKPESRFIQGLGKSDYSVHTRQSLRANNKTLTENSDVAFISSTEPHVDLFYKFENTKDVKVLKQLLDEAWTKDPLKTLKLIFQLRSIHVGKGEKYHFYKAMGWLYEWHPKTFLMNLPWIVRPVIEKKKSLEKQEKEAKAKEEDLGVIAMDEDDDFEMINPASAYNTTDLDLLHGHAHGYWKDLLNMLVLAVGGNLNVHDAEPLLNIPKLEKAEREWDHDKAKANRVSTQSNRFKVFSEMMAVPKYRAFQAAVARLFASQLAADVSRLKDGKEGDISLAAKWAPSPKEFHDKHTFVVASIAEIMFSHEKICPDVPSKDRVTYLKMARVAYRFQVLSPLRKALDVVERHLTAKSYADIKYQKVPSIAMKKYKGLFMEKDRLHFRDYLGDVNDGKATSLVLSCCQHSWSRPLIW
jgi:Domain of unknown function (DUF2828)